MQGFPSEGFVRDFNAKIHEDPRGDELLWRLEHKLCGLDLILIFVELCCGGKVVSPTRESISAYRAGEHSQADNLDDLAGRLTVMSKEVEATNKEIAGWLARYGQKPFGLPGEIHSYVSHVQAISKELRAVSLRTAPMDALNLLADCMVVRESDLDAMVKDLEEQQKELEKQPKSARRASAIAARVAQVGRIRESIGEIDYEDLALLLEIGYLAHGITKIEGIDAIKHRVARARDRSAKKVEQTLPESVYGRDFGGRKVS